MKKMLLVLFAALLALTPLAGCSNTEDMEDGGDALVSSEPEVEYSLQDAVDAVKEAYGEDYLPSMDLDETYLTETMGVDMENVEEFIAQGPMISAHVDTLVAVKAKEGLGGTVAQELDDYRNDLYDNSLNYPMNMPKIAASQVVTYGDYVFFLMLGKYNETDASEDELQKFYDEQTEIGVHALNAYFGEDEPEASAEA